MKADEQFDHLHRLIKHADISAVRRAIDAGVDASLSNAHGWTLLMLAAREGNMPLGEFLVSRGADIDAQTASGVTALSEALCGGHIPFMKMLLDRGAKRRSFGNVSAWFSKFIGAEKTKAVIAFLEHYETGATNRENSN